MEVHAKVTRFCLICNYVSRITEPITSRCAKFRFEPLDDAHMLSRLQHIDRAEGFNTPEPALRALLEVSGGDLRRSITLLQSVTQLQAAAAAAAKAEAAKTGTAPSSEFEGSKL